MDDLRLSMNKDDTFAHIFRVFPQCLARELDIYVKAHKYQPEYIRLTQALVEFVTTSVLLDIV